MALLIPIPQGSYDALVRLLNRVAPYDWARSTEIHVIAINDQHVASDADRVFAYCQDHDIDQVLVPSRIHLDEQMIAEAGYTVRSAASVRNLISGNGLLKHLSALKLDWRSKLKDRVDRFSLGTVDGPGIDRWLMQFERLGNHR